MLKIFQKAVHQTLQKQNHAQRSRYLQLNKYGLSSQWMQTSWVWNTGMKRTKACPPSVCTLLVGEGQLWIQKRGIDKNYKENTKRKVLVMGGIEKDSKTVSFEDGWDFDKQVEGRCLGEAVPQQAGPESP